MTFQKAKRLTMILVVLGLIVCILAATQEQGGSHVLPMLIAGIVIFLAGIAVCVMWCRCPHCNRVIMRKLMVLEDCPYCKHNLTTGLKQKKKKK